jgi:hypothetical protein
MSHWRTTRRQSGDNLSPGLHYGAGGTRSVSDSFAGATPLRRPDLAVVVKNRPFIQRELNPVEPLVPGFDHREFAAYIFLSCVGISVGVLLAAATAFLDWSY